MSKKNKPQSVAAKKGPDAFLKTISILLIVGGGVSLAVGLTALASTSGDVFLSLAAAIVGVGGGFQLAAGVMGFMERMRGARMCSWVLLAVGLLGLISNAISAVQGQGVPAILSGVAQIILPALFFAGVHRHK